MEVIALVGRAGTGKSHRATIIAHENDVTAIIDDGLLIKDGRIVAGSSAKREATMVAAVRRAIFSDLDHQEAMRSALAALPRPVRLLVLGTSKEMVHRICDALKLPRPDRYIKIEDIASPEEIRQARRTRRRFGKHVIPAPTVEVKRSFSGQLIDPLRFLYRPRRRASQPLVIEKTTVRPTFSSLGRFLIEENVLRSIVEYAAQQVPGIHSVLRTRLSSKSEGVRVQIEVSLLFGLPLPPVLRQVQQQVAANLEHMTALNILGVDVTARRVVKPSRRQDPVEDQEDSAEDNMKA